jgi:hypothetical protein
MSPADGERLHEVEEAGRVRRFGPTLPLRESSTSARSPRTFTLRADLAEPWRRVAGPARYSAAASPGPRRMPPPPTGVRWRMDRERG